MKVSQNNFNYAQKLSILDMTRRVSCCDCIEIVVFEHILKFFNWSRLVELGSDEMKMFYTEHDFQVDLENLRAQLELSCRENGA